MELQVNEREALLIVTALGMCQNRLGQHASWDERKRMRTLRTRQADAVTISDVEEQNALLHAMSNCKRRIQNTKERVLEVSALRERIKQAAGITDERANTDR